MSIAGSDHDESANGRPVGADAITAADRERLADEILLIIQRSMSPVMVGVFTIGPDGPPRLRRFVADPAWRREAPEAFDLGWLEPLLRPGAVNGTALVGPVVRGAQMIAAVMSLIGGWNSYLLIAGDYSDTEHASARLSRIASEAGRSIRVIMESTERAADTAALRERERLSRDLHDSLSQSLWSLSMLSETIQAMVEPSDPMHELIERIAHISLSSQEEMRSLLINLRSNGPSQQSLRCALESLVTEFRASHDVRLVASFAETELEPSAVTAFRRIAEEALNNVGRHAGASRVTVMVDADPLTLRIIDDGDGFDAKPLGGHLGLRIMKERAAEVGCSFEVSSSPTDGTTITVSAEPRRLRPIPRRRVPAPLPSLRSVVGFFAVGLLVAAMSAGLFVGGASRSADAERLRENLDVSVILRERVNTTRATADEAAERLLASIGLATANDVEGAATARASAIDAARRRLEPIAATDSRSGEHAIVLLGHLGDADRPDPPGGRLASLYEDFEQLAGGLSPPVREGNTVTESVAGLAALEQMVDVMLLDAVVARFAIDPGAFDPQPSAAVFLFARADRLDEVGGRLGPDPTVPLVGASISSDVASVHESAALAELEQIVVDAALWPDDRWADEWARDGEPPPTNLDIFAERARATSMDLRMVVDERLDARQRELQTNVGDSHRMASALTSAAIVALLLAPLLLLRALVLVLRRSRLMAIENTLDPLTGIGNRKMLETDVIPRLKHPSLRHHLILTLDMDRFKFINDVHGRAFGDEVLIVIGAGLDAVTSYEPRVEGTAVRIGGDEFLLSLHSARAIPAELVHQAMNRLRSTLVSADDGTLVRCAFSYGLVQAEGSPDLRTLMEACDLACYQEKVDRDAERANA